MRGRSIIVGAVIAASIFIGGYAPTVGGAAYTANLYLSSTAANDCTGGRSATKISYSQAVTENRVCQKWSTACTTAAGGDEVGVKSTGSLGQNPFGMEVPAQGATVFDTDCAAGDSPNDVDPTAQTPGTDPASVISNWVTFECADGETRDSVELLVANFNPHANVHMYIRGECFYFGAIYVGQGGDNSLTTQNFILDGAHIQGFDITGAKNIWFKNVEFGPVVICGQDGNPSLDEQYECDNPGVGYFESRWASYSGGSAGGSTGLIDTQGKVHLNSGSVVSENIVLEDMWVHDSQTKNAVAPNEWHTGCLIFQDQSSAATDNVIVRNVLCERVAVQGPYASEFSGLTLENVQTTCPTEPLDNVGETNYGTANCNQRAFHLNCSVSPCSNMLIRYNSFASAVDFISNTDVGTNVRAIGNIADSYIACPTDMTVRDYNVYVNGSACGTNGVDIVSSPFVDTTYGTSPTTVTEVDLHLGAAQDFEDDVTPTSADYALTKDMDLANRTSGSRDPGADER